MAGVARRAKRFKVVIVKRSLWYVMTRGHVMHDGSRHIEPIGSAMLAQWRVGELGTPYTFPCVAGIKHPIGSTIGPSLVSLHPSAVVGPVAGCVCAYLAWHQWPSFDA